MSDGKVKLAHGVEQKPKSTRRGQETGRKAGSLEPYPKTKRSSSSGYPGGSRASSNASDPSSAACTKRRKERLKKLRREKRKRALASETKCLIILAILLMTCSLLLIAYQSADQNSFEMAKGQAWDDSLRKIVWDQKPIHSPNPVLNDVLDYRQSTPRVAIMSNFHRCNQIVSAALMYQLSSFIGNAAELLVYCGEEGLGIEDDGHLERTIIGVDTDQTTNISGVAFSGEVPGLDFIHIAAKYNQEDRYIDQNRTFEMVMKECNKLRNDSQLGLIDVEQELFCRFYDETNESHKQEVRQKRLEAILQLYDATLSPARKAKWLDFSVTSMSELLSYSITPKRIDFFGKEFQIVRSSGPSLSFVSEYMLRVTIKCINETRPWLDYDFVVPICFAEAQKSAWIRLDDRSLHDNMTAEEQDELAQSDALIAKRKYDENKLEDLRKIPTIKAQPAACSLIHTMQNAYNEYGSVFKYALASCIHVKTDPPEKYTYAAPLFLYYQNECKVAVATSGGFRSVASSAAIILTSLFSADLKQEVLFPILDITGKPRWVIDSQLEDETVQILVDKLGSPIDKVDFEQNYRGKKSDERKKSLVSDSNYFEAYVIVAALFQLNLDMEVDTIYVQRCVGCIVYDQTGF